MNLQPHDLHLVFNPKTNHLAIWDANHHQVLACEAHNRTVADGQLGHFGNCPAGEFLLGEPIVKNTVPFGPFFIPVLDYLNHHTMRDFHREGIGIHGGGSGLPHPFMGRQGWVETEGCIRVQNVDLGSIVTLVRIAQKKTGKCYLTVI
jgi:hypothetical protein